MEEGQRHEWERTIVLKIFFPPFENLVLYRWHRVENFPLFRVERVLPVSSDIYVISFFSGVRAFFCFASGDFFFDLARKTRGWSKGEVAISFD
jgi:hypothetical protein